MQPEQNVSIPKQIESLAIVQAMFSNTTVNIFITANGTYTIVPDGYITPAGIKLIGKCDRHGNITVIHSESIQSNNS